MSNGSLRSVPARVRSSAPAARSIDSIVSEFVREMLAKGAARFELRQLTVSGGDHPVRDWPADESTTSDGLTFKIVAVAEEDAASMGGPIGSYALLAYDRDDKRYPSRQTLRVRNAALADALSPSEPASLEGLLSQLMRHNEILLRVSLGHTEGIIKSYEHDRDVLLSETSKTISDRLKLATTLEELFSRKSERETEAMKVHAELRRKDMVGQLFAQYVPHLAAQALANVGVPVSPQTPHPTGPPGTPAASPNSFTPEQIARVVEHLTPEQIMLAIDVLSNKLEKLEVEASAKDAAKKGEAAPPVPPASE